MNKYTILGRIGEGAHGVVMKARNKEDLKPANLLIGESGTLKIADFGLARIFHTTDKARNYSHQVATRTESDTERRLSNRVREQIPRWIMQGIEKELDDLPDYNKITFEECAPKPLEDLLPNSPNDALELISQFLILQPSRRISAADALLHGFFTNEPLPTHLSDLPKPGPIIRNEVCQSQSNYESCLTRELKSIVVSRKLLNNGAQLFENMPPVNAQKRPIPRQRSRSKSTGRPA